MLKIGEFSATNLMKSFIKKRWHRFIDRFKEQK